MSRDQAASDRCFGCADRIWSCIWTESTCGIFSFQPFRISHGFAGIAVKNPAIIAICIMNQKTASPGSRYGEGKSRK